MDLQHVEAQLGARAHHHASMGGNILHAVSLEHLPKHSLHPCLLCRLIICLPLLLPLCHPGMLSHPMDSGIGQNLLWI